LKWQECEITKVHERNFHSWIVHWSSLQPTERTQQWLLDTFLAGNIISWSRLSMRRAFYRAGASGAKVTLFSWANTTKIHCVPNFEAKKSVRRSDSLPLHICATVHLVCYKVRSIRRWNSMHLLRKNSAWNYVYYKINKCQIY